MKCKICGADTDNGVLCENCREDIDHLSVEMTAFKRQINLDFDKHHQAYSSRGIK